MVKQQLKIIFSTKNWKPLQFTALLIGVVYWKQELNQEGIMNINGALFIFLGNVTYVNVIAVVNVSSWLFGCPLWKLTWILTRYYIKKMSRSYHEFKCSFLGRLSAWNYQFLSVNIIMVYILWEHIFSPKWLQKLHIFFSYQYFSVWLVIGWSDYILH